MPPICNITSEQHLFPPKLRKNCKPIPLKTHTMTTVCLSLARSDLARVRWRLDIKSNLYDSFDEAASYSRGEASLGYCVHMCTSLGERLFVPKARHWVICTIQGDIKVGIAKITTPRKQGFVGIMKRVYPC